MNHTGANLNPALPCFKDEARHVLLYGRQKTQASWMNPAGSTISLVGNKSITILTIIYLPLNFLEVGIIDRVETKDGAGFTMRDAL